MILKYVVAGVVLLLIWMIAFRSTRPGKRRPIRSPRAAKTLKTTQLVKCGGCGIYLPAEQTCTCTDRS